MAECQSPLSWLTLRHREQAPSHICFCWDSENLVLQVFRKSGAEPTINGQAGTGDIPRFRSGQIGHETGNLFHMSVTPHRH